MVCVVPFKTTVPLETVYPTVVPIVMFPPTVSVPVPKVSSGCSTVVPLVASMLPFTVNELVVPVSVTPVSAFSVYRQLNH